MNRITMSGNLTADPEMRYTPSGTAVTNGRMGVRATRELQGGEVPLFMNWTAWGKLGENAADYLRKGRGVIVSGELRARSYETRDGDTREVLFVNADTIEFLPDGKGGDDDDRPRQRSKSRDEDEPRQRSRSRSRDRDDRGDDRRSRSRDDDGKRDSRDFDPSQDPGDQLPW